MTTLSTTALEEMRKENNVLKTDNTQLRTEVDAMKDEITQLKAKQRDDIGQLTTILDKMAVNNENQIQQINSQSSEIVQLQTENQQLKVSWWSGITKFLTCTPTTNTLWTQLTADTN